MLRYLWSMLFGKSNRVSDRVALDWERAEHSVEMNDDANGVKTMRIIRSVDGQLQIICNEGVIEFWTAFTPERIRTLLTGSGFDIGSYLNHPVRWNGQVRTLVSSVNHLVDTGYVTNNDWIVRLCDDVELV